MSDHHAHPHLGHDQAAWDDRYSADAQMWSGNVNEALVAEVSGLAPARALDVGCGEGADAIWLAQRGWRVTAIDVSTAALARARDVANAAHVEIAWQQTGLEELPAGSFDLVSVFYPALLKAGGALNCLLGQVAPGGTLLVVHHAHLDRERALSHGFDPDQLLSHEDLVNALRLDPDWSIQLDEIRQRTAPSGAGAHHTSDVVLRATRH